MGTTSSLQNISWLNKRVSCLYKGGKCLLSQSNTFPTQCFSLLLEGRVHQDGELGIMTNVGKNKLVKVIFTNIHKISNACTNSFGRYIMIAQCMRNIFTFY